MKKIHFNQLFKAKSKPTVGIDIGSNSIKIVEFQGEGAGRTLKRIGRAGIPMDSIVDGSIKDSETVSATLKRLLNNLDIRTKRASASISGYSVIVKRITVPYETEKDIEDNLLAEAEKYVPFEIDEVYIDFYILSGPDKEKPGSDIFLVAAKKEIVDQYAGLLESVGLTPAVIDVDAFALGNSFELAFGNVTEPAALVDIGASKTNLNVIINGTPIFARDMAIGGNQLTEAISDTTGLDREESERLKISGSKDDSLRQEAAGLIREYMELWADEIKKAIDFYRSGSPVEEHPKHLFLSGGSTLFKGIENQFQQRMKMDVSRLNPFARLGQVKEINPEYLDEVAPQFAIASGLGIRSSE